MRNIKITTRYAKALLRLSVEQNLLDTVSKDLEFVTDTIEKSHELKIVLKNPVIRNDKKIKILTSIFDGKISSVSLKFIQLIIRRHRAELLLDVINTFFSLRDDYLNIKPVLVKSAYELDSEIFNRINEILKNITGKEPCFKFQIDKSLIGGFIVQIDDTIYDGSIKHQLQLLKKKFKLGTIPLN